MNFFTSIKNKIYLADPFIVRPDGSIITYGYMSDLSAQFATFLNRLGINKGDRLMMYASKSPEALISYIACLRAGIIFVPINPAYTKAELEYFIQDSQPKAIVVDASNEGFVKSIINQIGVSVQILYIDKNYESLLRKTQKIIIGFEEVACKDETVAAIVYTSGTTGRSKGAMITHGNLRSNAEALRDIWRFSQKDVLLHTLPIFHVHGLFVATNITLIVGSSMIFLSNFDVDEVIKHISDATVIMGVPTFYTLLLQDDRLVPDLVKYVRLFISGSAPLLPETHREWFERTGHMILERYGMTETGMITSSPYESERVPGTVGLPLPGISVRIVDQSTGDPLSQGEIGLIDVKGPNVFRGYWQMPEKTAEEFRSDGFFITGDLGFIDQKGYIHIVGRQKDLIITCGLNVCPKEIEERLNRIRGVAESAVIGVPHHDFGEGVVAVVATKSANISEEDLSVELKKNLAQYKIPLKIIFTDALPKNAMRKVQKNLLRSKYNNIFSTKI